MKHIRQLNMLTQKFELLAKDLGFDNLAICDAKVRFDKKDLHGLDREKNLTVAWNI